MTNQNLNIKCAIVSPDEKLSKTIAGIIAEVPDSVPARILAEYPDSASLGRLLRFNAFQIMIVDCRQLEPAIEFIQQLLTQPHAPEIIAVCEEDVPTLARLMRLKVTDYVVPSLDKEKFQAALGRALHLVKNRPAESHHGEIISFLPVKAGAGASIIASNTSAAIARVEGTKTLLVDFDLTAGTIAFLLKFAPEHTVRDVLSNIHQMDDQLWMRLKNQVGNLDVISADVNVAEPVNSDRLLRMLQFFRESYDVTCVDLAGGFDHMSMDILRESRTIYLVTTQELACQHMLCRKAQVLRSRGFEADIKVLINRFESNNVLDESRIQQMTGLPTEITIPNDYKQVSSQIRNGGVIDPRTPAGKKFDALAAAILKRQPPAVERKRRFVDYFSMINRSETASVSSYS